MRIIVVRSGRTESWTFDVTEKTDLEDLAERIEATVREANGHRCEMIEKTKLYGRILGALGEAGRCLEDRGTTARCSSWIPTSSTQLAS